MQEGTKVSSAELYTYDHSGFHYQYKLLVVGDHNTGKKKVLSTFTKDTLVTVGLPSTRTVRLDEQRIKLQVVVPHYSDSREIWYSGAAGALVVYSTVKNETFLNVPYWMDELKKHAHPDIKMVLVGTKCDCVDERAVDYITAREFAGAEHIPFLEVSNKDGTNVELAFMMIVTELRQLYIS